MTLLCCEINIRLAPQRLKSQAVKKMMVGNLAIFWHRYDSFRDKMYNLLQKVRKFKALLNRIYSFSKSKKTLFMRDTY